MILRGNIKNKALNWLFHCKNIFTVYLNFLVVCCVDVLTLGLYVSSLNESWNIASESSDIVDSSSIFKRKKTPGGMKYAKKGNLPYTLGAEMGRGEKR